LARAQGKTLKISQALFSPHPLFFSAVFRQLVLKSRSGAQKPYYKSVGKIFNPFHESIPDCALASNLLRRRISKDRSPILVMSV